MGLSYKTHEDVRLEILSIFIKSLLDTSLFVEGKLFMKTDNKINQLDNYKRNLISRFKTLRHKAMELGSKESFLKKWKFLLVRKESLNIQFS